MKLHFEETGDGPPALLLHGFTGSSADWMPLIPLLPPSYRYLVPDLRGHGRSPNPESSYTHRQSALDVFELLDMLGVDRFKACGMSGGAMALLHMATQQPNRIESMVLVSPTTHYADQTRAIMGAVDIDSKSEEEWELMRKRHPGGDEQILKLWTQARAFKDDVDDMNFQPSDLQTIRARTWIVHGSEDPLIPQEIAEQMLQHIPNASLWIIEGGGHVPVFGESMNDFFARASQFFENQSTTTHPPTASMASPIS